jgi:opacity protein-like surface antigen
MTKVKKISCTAAVILMGAVAGSALAGSRVYVGGELGGASFTDAKNITYTPVSGGQPTHTPSNSQGTGESGSVFVGVGQRFTNGFDLAGQLDAAYFNANSKQTAAGNAWVKEKINTAYGVSVMPGWYFAKNSKVFLKVGAGVGGFKTSSSTALVGDHGYNGPLSKQDKYMVYGIGFATKVSKNLRLGLEYDSYQFAKFDSPKETAGTQNKVVDFKPTMNMGAMTLTYVW